MADGEWTSCRTASPIFLNVPVREFRVPFTDVVKTRAFTGEVLRLELRNTYGPADAEIYEVGLYIDGQTSTERAEALLWITPLPETDPATVGLPAVVPSNAGSDGLTLLGNPFSMRFYNNSGWENARSVWDMQRWGDRIYLAHGDGHANAGPTDVWYFDLASSTFVKDTTVDEEQISSFVEAGETLYIPGLDPREHGDSPEWEWGNLYSYSDSEWEKQRTIPWGLHLYDVLSHDGLLFASGDGSEAYVTEGEMKLAFCHVSADGGETWELHYPSSVNKLEELFVLNDTVYASGAYNSLFLRWDGASFVESSVAPFPDLPPFSEEMIERSNAPMLPLEWRGDPSVMLRASHVTDWLNGILYLCNAPYTRQAAETNGTRHVPGSLGIYYATAIEEGRIKRLEFVPNDMMPRDIVVQDGVAYVLVVGTELDSRRASVYATSELGHWKSVVSEVSLPASAYSMEVAEGKLFLGLGGPSVHSGEIHMVEIP